jgi:hypothetical protein
MTVSISELNNDVLSFSLWCSATGFNISYKYQLI